MLCFIVLCWFVLHENQRLNLWNAQNCISLLVSVLVVWLAKLGVFERHRLGPSIIGYSLKCHRLVISLSAVGWLQVSIAGCKYHWLVQCHWLDPSIIGWLQVSMARTNGWLHVCYWLAPCVIDCPKCHWLAPSVFGWLHVCHWLSPSVIDISEYRLLVPSVPQSNKGRLRSIHVVCRCALELAMSLWPEVSRFWHVDRLIPVDLPLPWGTWQDPHLVNGYT